MENPEFLAKLHRVDHAKGITLEPQCDLKHARAQPVQGFCNAGLPAIRHDRQGRKTNRSGSCRKVLDFLPCCFEPGNGPCFSRHRLSASGCPILILKLSYLTTLVKKTRQLACVLRQVLKRPCRLSSGTRKLGDRRGTRSEEHTSELQSHLNLVCRLLLEKKKKIIKLYHYTDNLLR